MEPFNFTRFRVAWGAMGTPATRNQAESTADGSPSIDPFGFRLGPGAKSVVCQRCGYDLRGNTQTWSEKGAYPSPENAANAASILSDSESSETPYTLGCLNTTGEENLSAHSSARSSPLGRLFLVSSSSLRVEACTRYLNIKSPVIVMSAETIISILSIITLTMAYGLVG